MIINFNAIGEAKTPKMTLHNPNGKQIDIISEFKDMKLEINLMDISTLSFSIPHNNLFFDELFERIVRKRIVRVENIGQFTIDEPVVESDGITKWKHVTCRSIELELNDVTIRILEGVYKFYDPNNPSETILGKVMEYLPNWTISEVDSDLWNVKRIFDDVTDKAYAFLQGVVSETFNCVFIFNTMNRTIRVKKYHNVPKYTDIVAGYSNVVKNLEIREMPNGIFTCLNVIGSGDISIHEVNPLGTSKIYNWDYYMNYRDKDGQPMMSIDLINAIKRWKTKYDASIPTYKMVIDNIKRTNVELITLNQQLVELKNQYSKLDLQHSANASGGLPVSEIRQQMYNKQNEIDAKEIEVQNKQSQLDSYINQKLSINKSLSLTNIENFTDTQRDELFVYTVEDTYADEYICITDEMTENEKMDVYQELYDKAVGILVEVSQPTYEFNTSFVNYMMLQEYEEFTKQTELGCVIRLEIEKGKFAYPILLGYTLEFDKDKRSNLDMRWSSTLRLKSEMDKNSKLFNKAVTGGNKVGLDSHKWNRYEKDKSGISQYIKGDLDLSNKILMNSTNQEIIMNESGMTMRKFDELTKRYSPKQAKWIANMLGYTKDDWQTVDGAFGEISLPDGTKTYGLIGQAIVGKILIGNELYIENESLTFKVDTNGATLLNADFTIENTNNKILLSPSIGIKVQSKNGSVLEDIFYINPTNKRLTVKGDIYAENGRFSGEVFGATILGGNANFGNGKFTVDDGGNCIANSIRILGGEFDAAKVLVKNLVVGENVTMGANAMLSWDNVSGKPTDLARLGDVPTPTQIQGIASTQITSTLVASPRIVSPVIEGGSITGTTLTGLSRVQTGTDTSAGVVLDRVGVSVYDTRAYRTGEMKYDNTVEPNTNTNKFLVGSVGGYSLKLYSDHNMSLKTKDGYSIWMGSNVRLASGVKIYDASGQEIGGSGVAVFG